MPHSNTRSGSGAHSNDCSTGGKNEFDWSTADSALATGHFHDRARRWLARSFSLVAILLASCAAPPDEQALRENIDAIETAVEERSLAGVMDYVTEDFGGSQGFDRDALRRLLQAQILVNTNIGVTIGPITIKRKGERATATFSVILTGGNGRFVPERGRAYAVKSGWRIEDGEWKVYVAEWDNEGAG